MPSWGITRIAIACMGDWYFSIAGWRLARRKRVKRKPRAPWRRWRGCRRRIGRLSTRRRSCAGKIASAGERAWHSPRRRGIAVRRGGCGAVARHRPSGARAVQRRLVALEVKHLLLTGGWYQISAEPTRIRSLHTGTPCGCCWSSRLRAAAADGAAQLARRSALA